MAKRTQLIPASDFIYYSLGEYIEYLKVAKANNQIWSKRIPHTQYYSVSHINVTGENLLHDTRQKKLNENPNMGNFRI